MIRAANRDIRRQLQLAELRRAQITNSPFAHLDHLIAELEDLHLDDLRYVPTSFVPALRAVNQMLPEGTGPIPEGGSIRGAIDRCFDIQEQLLELGRSRTLGGPGGAQDADILGGAPPRGQAPRQP
jgi:hypothetical protein